MPGDNKKRKRGPHLDSSPSLNPGSSPDADLITPPTSPRIGQASSPKSHSQNVKRERRGRKTWLDSRDGQLPDHAQDVCHDEATLPGAKKQSTNRQIQIFVKQQWPIGLSEETLNNPDISESLGVGHRLRYVISKLEDNQFALMLAPDGGKVYTHENMARKLRSDARVLAAGTFLFNKAEPHKVYAIANDTGHYCTGIESIAITHFLLYKYYDPFLVPADKMEYVDHSLFVRPLQSYDSKPPRYIGEEGRIKYVDAVLNNLVPGKLEWLHELKPSKLKFCSNPQDEDTKSFLESLSISKPRSSGHALGLFGSTQQSRKDDSPKDDWLSFSLEGNTSSALPNDLSCAFGASLAGIITFT